MPSSKPLSMVDAAMELQARRQARARLIPFAQYVDREASRWYRAPHLAQIAAKLEAVERGEIARLIISTPPRHWKSSLTSEKFPGWYLGHHPDRAVVLASYAVTLAEKFSRSVRESISGNSRYRVLFPQVRIREDSNRADDWLLESGVRSSLRAVGTGGGLTGHGANLIVVDDPIAGYEDAQSEKQRENLWQWYLQVLRTRLEPGGAIVLILTRWHEDDLAGRLLKAEKEQGGEHWDTLTLPARSERGEWLWPERYSEAEYGALMAAQGGEHSYGWLALYQQAPTRPEGTLIQSKWFEVVPQLPEGATWQVAAFDCAFSEKQTQKNDPDFTARVCGTKANNWLYLGLPALFRKDEAGVAKEIVEFKRAHPAVRLGMGRVAVKAQIVRALSREGMAIIEYDESTDKVARSSAWRYWAANGRVKLVGTAEEWEAFMSQWTAFPHGAHDDGVDAVSGVAEMLGVTLEPPAESKPVGPALRSAWDNRR